MGSLKPFTHLGLFKILLFKCKIQSSLQPFYDHHATIPGDCSILEFEQVGIGPTSRAKNPKMDMLLISTNMNTPQKYRTKDLCMDPVMLGKQIVTTEKQTITVQQ